MQHQNNEIQGKLDETNRTLNDFDSAKKKLSIENSDLLRQLEEAESQVSQLSKIKISLTTQLEDTKRLADEEGRVSCENCQCELEVVLCGICSKYSGMGNADDKIIERVTEIRENPRKISKPDKFPIMAEFPILDEHIDDTISEKSTGNMREYYSVLPGFSIK